MLNEKLAKVLPKLPTKPAAAPGAPTTAPAAGGLSSTIAAGLASAAARGLPVKLPGVTHPAVPTAVATAPTLTAAAVAAGATVAPPKPPPVTARAPILRLNEHGEEIDEHGNKVRSIAHAHAPRPRTDLPRHATRESTPRVPGALQPSASAHIAPAADG